MVSHSMEEIASNVDRLIADMQSVDGWRTEFLPWASGLMLCVRD